MCLRFTEAKVRMFRANLYVKNEKLFCFVDYFQTAYVTAGAPREKAITFIFDSKAGNALAVSSTLLPEVFKPRTDKQFVKVINRQTVEVLILPQKRPIKLMAILNHSPNISKSQSSKMY